MSYDYVDEETLVARPARRGGGLLVVLFVLVLLLGGTEWFLWKLFRNADHDLSSTRAKVTALESDGRTQKMKLEAAEAERDRLTKANAELSDAKDRLVAAESRVGELESERAEIGTRLAEFREITEKFKSMIDAGTLQITFRRGRAIVNLPAGVLFDSGSAELSAEGSKTVAEVAKILRGVPKRRFIVAGHTDNVPAVKEYKSNWTLSTARAVNVLEAMVRAGLGASNLAAAGYAEYDPVSSNGSAAGKQKNRRIEIVLEPYLTAPPKDK
jgi:chemotaxis protein MotB